MNLPKICPNCRADFENDFPYYARGIQYCNGTVFDFETNPSKGKEPNLELSIEGNSSWVSPYEVQCGDCGHVLWERHLIVNEEKFFVKKGEEK